MKNSRGGGKRFRSAASCAAGTAQSYALRLDGSFSENTKGINALIREIRREPFAGIGKPEPLRHGLSGYWSRRINDEHRLVYKCSGSQILIAQLRYHYSD